MPTVAALRPDSSAYTGLGRVFPIYATPTARPYMPMAPGRLKNCQPDDKSTSARQTYLNIKMARVPAKKPPWIVFIQKSILTLAEPGRA